MNPEPSTARLFTVRFQVTFGLLVGLALALTIGLYVLYPTWRTALKDLTTIVGGVTLVAAAFYARESVLAQHRQLERHEAKERQNNAFGMLASFEATEYSKTRIWVFRELHEKGMSGAAMMSFIEKDPENEERTLKLLGFFEDMALAIKRHHVEEDILYYSLSYPLIFHFVVLRPYIEEMRRDKREIAANRKNIFCEVEDLYTAWNQKVSLVNPGHRFLDPKQA